MSEDISLDNDILRTSQGVVIASQDVLTVSQIWIIITDPFFAFKSLIFLKQSDKFTENKSEARANKALCVYSVI